MAARPRYAVTDDQDLWERLRVADEAALADLFHRHSDAVYNFAFRRTSSWASAEDVVQATFVALWRRARAGKIDRLTLASARPLLLVMAGYEAGNVLRASRRQAALTDRIELIDRTGTVPDHSGEAAARVDDERSMSQTRRLLDRIPAKQREVVELVIWSECSIAEAARALGVPEGTVKSRLARARTRLAGLLDLGTTEGLE
ncbi:RNA polymerase sigma-70 factor (ECF subfamily) [Kribbella voronezhensis]|uniref:RNA polymerase sigma-70 factor (ECF subfamily) n=2 Tax=Kribbella voronezhensis TaxID=2512212 RepID=A0A4R7SW92_9ACTN|nr:RNA polymerase sigma-70 factor (ECF subfamily) [Kribbella voronezhensis]